MTLLDAIHALTDASMLHAVAIRAAGFWLAQAMLTGLWVAAFTFNRPSKVWRD